MTVKVWRLQRPKDGMGERVAADGAIGNDSSVAASEGWQAMEAAAWKP